MAVPRVQMEKSSAARAETDGLLDFFLERERRRAGIDLSSLPISLKFQINKIHFSAPLPSPAQQTKEKQFPAVCSKLLSQFRSFLTSASGSCQRPGEPRLRGWAGEGAQKGTCDSAVPPSQKWPSAENSGHRVLAAFAHMVQHLVPPALPDTGSISPCQRDPLQQKSSNAKLGLHPPISNSFKVAKK